MSIRPTLVSLLPAPNLRKLAATGALARDRNGAGVKFRCGPHDREDPRVVLLPEVDGRFLEEMPEPQR